MIINGILLADTWGTTTCYSPQKRRLDWNAANSEAYIRLKSDLQRYREVTLSSITSLTPSGRPSRPTSVGLATLVKAKRNELTSIASATEAFEVARAAEATRAGIKRRAESKEEDRGADLGQSSTIVVSNKRPKTE